MPVYRIAVCDDVAAERNMLCTLLHNCDKRLIIYQFSSGEELLSSQNSFDLVFLDIYMTGMTGMETARVLQSRNDDLPIVFLTATSDFALESYEVHAFDYIVKPLHTRRLEVAWKRFLLTYQESPRLYIVNHSGKTVKLLYEQIEFLESDRHYVTIHMADGETIRIQGKLDDLEQQFDDPRFLRCHKSFLINLSLVEAMEDEFVMQSGKCVPYRKREKKKMQNVFCDHMMKEARLR